MTAGFECHIERGATRASTRLFERQNFRMRKTRAEMKALPDDSPLFDDQRADHGVRTGRPGSLGRQAKGLGHEMEVVRHRFLRDTAFTLADGRRDFAAAFLETVPAFLGAAAACFASASAKAACAAASLAIATR